MQRYEFPFHKNPFPALTCRNMQRSIRWPLVLVLFALWALPSAVGQNKKAVVYFEKARASAYAKEYGQAVAWTQKALAKDPTYGAAALLKGDLYSVKGPQDSAYSAYRQAFEKHRAGNIALLRWGQLAHKNERFSEADSLFQVCIKLEKPGTSIRKMAERMQPTAAFAARAVAHPLPYTVLDLGDTINRMELNYFPVPVAADSLLLFTGKNDTRAPYDENLFYSRMKKGGGWTVPQLLPGKVNTSFNEGAVAIRGDGGYLVFAGCDRPEGKGSCDLYGAVWTSKGWSEAFSLGDSLNTPQWETQPTLSSDGRLLLFVRAPERDKNQSTLFYSTLRDDGTWTRAKPLPGKVNTPYNDICPRLHADGNTLYFSSDGHLGMGGLDLFVSRRSPDGTWGEPTNMGYPINSTQDDFGLAVSPDGKTGYMGRGGLYENRGIRLFGYGLPVEVQPEPIQWFEAVALDDRTGKPVRASWRIEANRLFQGTDFEGPRYSTGLLPQRSYSLQVAAPGYNLVSDRFEVGAIGARIEKTYRLVPLEDNQRVVLQNILFQTDSTRIQPVAKSELDAVARWLSVNPNVHLVLEGHTDNQGAANYNRALSQGRAESVKKALVERGIDATRLEAKGYGPDRPVAPNSTPEGRALNRRTEMLIKSK